MKVNKILALLLVIAVVSACGLFKKGDNEATKPLITQLFLNDNFLKLSEDQNTVSTGVNVAVFNPSDISLSCKVSTNYGTIDREIQRVSGDIVTCRLIIRYELLFSTNPGDVIPGTISAEITGDDGTVYDKVSVNYNIYIIEEKDAVTGKMEKRYNIILDIDSEMKIQQMQIQQMQIQQMQIQQMYLQMQMWSSNP